MNYNDLSKKTTSIKEVLCHIEPVRKLNVFTLVSGAIYKKKIDYYCISVNENDTSLVEASSSALNSGEFYFDYETFELYVRTSDDLEPDKKDIIATFRLFFSSMPYDLPHDLNNGNSVYYEPLLRSNSPISFEIDEEQKGIALDSKCRLSLENENGFFDNIYDRLIFEEKRIKLWSWAPSILLSEARPIFNGIIKNKSFKDTLVTFNAVDLIGKLKEPLSLNLFSSSDGNLDEFELQKPKRRIYGQVQQAKAIGIDKLLDGYQLTSTISGNKNQTTITGSNFLDELSPKDEIIIILGNSEFAYSVESVDSDTQATLSDEIEASFVNVSATVRPEIPYRRINRRFHIGTGLLFEKTTTVTKTVDKARIEVANTDDFFPEDIIKIDGELNSIRRISGNTIVLNSTLSGLVSVGASVTKPPVYRVQYRNNIPLDLTIDRDWTLSNGTDVILELNDLAEFNATTQRRFNFDLTFTNGSREVTTVENINFKTDFKSRDWIRSTDINHAVWYEILQVEEQKLTLRTAYNGDTTIENYFAKNVSYINDDTLLLFDSVGIADNSGNWIKTGSDVVRHLVNEDAQIDIDLTSFQNASSEIPYIISKIEPEEVGGSIRQIKQVIKDINDSILGSLHTDTNLNIVYNVIDPRKPDTTEILKDDDIIDFSVQSSNKIIKKVTAFYRPFVDRFTGENTFKKYENESNFVNRLIGTKDERNVNLYLFEDSKAKIMAERITFYNSLSSAIVRVSSKLNLSLKSLNDKIWINFDRLYGRFGSNVNQKIGIINKITFNGRDTEVEFNDLGNVFNRSLNISPNDAVNYSTASDEAKLFNGHVVSNDELLPDINDEDGSFTQRLV